MTNARRLTTKLQRICLLLTLLLLSAHTVRADGVVPGYVLVRVEDWVNMDVVLAALGVNNSGGMVERVPNTNIYAVNLPWLETEHNFAARVRSIRGVRYAETDTYAGDPKSVPVDEIPPSPQLSSNLISNLIPQRATLTQIMDAGLSPVGYVNQPAYPQIGLGNSHTLSTGRGIKVAILDTGVYPAHATLYGRCTQGFNALNGNLLPLDLPDTIFHRLVGHGTMIAGLIARIAPDADIVPVRVLNADGIATGLSVAKGVMFAESQGARVLSLSFSTDVSSQVLDEVIQIAQASGVVVVASAGNEGEQRTRYPAGMAGVIAVASVETDGTRSAFSNYGRYIDICAPGSAIVGANYNGGYTTWSGTSFAVPFVAAQAALILERDNSLSPAQVLTKIQSTARSISAQNPGMERRLGSGQIAIEASLRATPRR